MEEEFKQKYYITYEKIYKSNTLYLIILFLILFIIFMIVIIKNYN